MTAPIALFVYNRLEHTKKTVEALKQNDLASESDLYVFSDAAKSSETTAKVQAVREYISNINGFRSVTIINRDHNLGLAASIIDGVTQLCNSFGRVIVLEDDIITSRGFLRFMNDALKLYADDKKIMHISGYMFNVDKPDEIPDSFFYRVPSCWGWATWKRAWDHFEVEAKDMLGKIKIAKRNYDFDIENTYAYSEMLKMQASGKINSWAIRWYGTIFLNEGLCLHPNRSFTNNIGMDGSGTHCGTNNAYEIMNLRHSSMFVTKLKFEENRIALQKIKHFNKSNMPPLYRRVANKTLKTVKKLLLKG